MKRTLRPVNRSRVTSHQPQLAPRSRFVLAGVIGGGAAVGASLADIMGAVAAVDRNLTESEARLIIGELLAARLVELSGVDRSRYVATRKGIEEMER